MSRFKIDKVRLYKPPSETKDARRIRMCLYVLDHEVSHPRSEPIDRNWLYENVGPRRAFHPMNEALTGYFDYYEGEWALDRESERSYLWFGNLLDMSKYLLFFGGRHSKHDIERRRELYLPLP